MLWIAAAAILMMACSLSSGLDFGSEKEATPTPTTAPGGAIVTSTVDNTNRCEGLSGYFELQLLVGPSDAVGLDPLAIGDIPFSVTTSEAPYFLEGINTITYEDVYTAEWGTYSVSFNMDVSVNGECSGETGAEQIMVEVNMTGDQLVEVEAEGFQGEYPWNGSVSQSLTLPLEEGATAGGEGWQIVLHID